MSRMGVGSERERSREEGEGRSGPLGWLRDKGDEWVQLLHLRQRPQLYERTIPLPRLPQALDGLRVVQLSDFHRSLIVLNDIIERAIDLAMEQQPDLIAVTGDFITGSADKIDYILPLLRRLQAPLGVWGVLGNHDHESGEVEVVRAGVEAAGIRVLDNAAVPIDAAGERWWIAGVDDQRTEDADLESALQGVPDRDFKLLLSHCPDYADHAARFGVDLQLSGHSHGPQLGFWPASWIRPHCGRKYVRGLYRVGDTRTFVYTNVGIGVVSLPIRVNRPPEVSLLTLRRGDPTDPGALS